MGTRDFKLPDLGEGLEDADIVRWLVGEGDPVALNQPLVEVDTAKALVEIPSPIQGNIGRLHAAAGDTVKVGAVLVTFEVADDSSVEQPIRKAVLVGYGVDEASTAGKRRRLKIAPKSPEVGRGRESKNNKDPGDSVSAAPPVRSLAAQLGIDLKSVSGSGPGGRITREDVMAASGQSSSTTEVQVAASSDQRIPVKGPRKLIAQKMVRSVTEIPHVTTYLSVDATALLHSRETAKAKNADVSALSVIARAFVEICRAHPLLNSTWSDQEIILRERVDLGIAIDTERGLVVPVIPDASSRSVADLTGEIARLAGLARKGGLKPEDLTGGTVTISNVGSFGAEFGTPIINHPEACILAVGIIQERAVVIDGGVHVRPVVTLSLSFDHRIMDGAQAGRALLDLKQKLEDYEWYAAL